MWTWRLYYPPVGLVFLLLPATVSQTTVSVCVHMKGYTYISAILQCERVCSLPELWQVDGVFRDPSHSLRGTRHQQRNPPPHVSAPQVHASPPGALTAAAARRGPLVKPCCHTPWHLPPISPLKVPKSPPLNVWFLFIHVVFLPSCPHALWITLKIYSMSKAAQSGLPVYGSCQEAVMFVRSAQLTHCLMDSWAWRWKVSVNVCVCVYAHMLVYNFAFECRWHRFDYTINATLLKLMWAKVRNNLNFAEAGAELCS